MPPLETLPDLVGLAIARVTTDPVEQLGNVTVGTLVVSLAAVLGLGFAVMVWLNARFDEINYYAAEAFANPLVFPYHLRSLRKDSRNAFLIVELFVAILLLGVLIAIGQHLSTGGQSARPTAFASFGSLVFVSIEFRLIWGTWLNVRDHRLDSQPPSVPPGQPTSSVSGG
jgi:hypothetical protein